MKIILIAFAGICSCSLGAQKLTAGEIINRIRTNVTCEWSDETVDTYKSGGSDDEITGVATTFLSNLDVLKRAKAQGLNMVITHEPTFYNHFDHIEPYENDPILQEKNGIYTRE